MALEERTLQARKFVDTSRAALEYGVQFKPLPETQAATVRDRLAAQKAARDADPNEAP